jgi:hypothetical protein
MDDQTLRSPRRLEGGAIVVLAVLLAGCSTARAMSPTVKSTTTTDAPLVSLVPLPKGTAQRVAPVQVGGRKVVVHGSPASTAPQRADPSLHSVSTTTSLNVTVAEPQP